MIHQCLTDNEWDIEIKCHICNKKLSGEMAEKCWDMLKYTKW